MILDVLRLEEEVKRLQGGPAGKGGDAGEVGRLRKELDARDRDIANLKKQGEGFQREYNRLGDEKAGADPTAKKDK